MKILLIGFTKIKFMPYMNFYLDNINPTENDISLIYWNRDLEPEDTSFLSKIHLFEFKCFQQDDSSKLLKIGSFIKYRRFVKRILHRNQFDYIIVMHSLPALLIKRELTIKYKKRYIFDYRDSTYERYTLFKKQIQSIQRDAHYTFVSSDGFRIFFDEKEQKRIITSHNLLIDSLNKREYVKKPADVIRISFWGFIRDEAINRIIIKKISADTRFELHYYGREQQIANQLKEFVRNNNIKNVFFHGAYNPKDRYEFAKETDLIHNIYDDKNAMIAMGNKYYDGLLFRIPQLFMINSFMGKIGEGKGVGIQCNPINDDFLNLIYHYYTSLDFNTFRDKTDSALNEIMDEYNYGKSIIENLK